MIRLRRYRVFLGVAAFILLAVYYLTDARGWSGRSPVVFKNAPSNADVFTAGQDAASDKSRGRKIPKDSMFKNSKSDSQIAIPGADSSTSKGSSFNDDGDRGLAFPQKKPFDEPAIDERLPRGKHDTKPTSSITDIPPHFTKLPENFPVPDDFVIKLPGGKPKSVPRIQHKFPRETTLEKNERNKKLKRLKKTFLKHWAGYKEYAWDHDELKPVSGGYQDPFAGWRATLVDTLDMLWIMGLKEEFEEAVEEVGTIDFTTTKKDMLPLFEVAIRYMGGLLGAYDISEGRYPVLLDKAKELGQVLMGAFDTPNRMPMTFYRWHTQDRKHARAAFGTTILAEIGSLSMEFIRLAQITKNNRYYDAVARITDEFEIWQNSTKVPGLWPLNVDASGGCSMAEVERDRKAKEQEAEDEVEGELVSSSKYGKQNAKIPPKGSDSKFPSQAEAAESVDSSLVEEVVSKEKGKVTKSGKGSAQASKKSSAAGKTDVEPTIREETRSEEPKKSLEKRAPPRYEDRDGAKAAESLTELVGADEDADEVVTPAKQRKQKPVSDDDDTKSSAKPNGKSKEDLVDDDTERLEVFKDAKPASSYSEAIRLKGKESFANDELDELERPTPKSSQAKGESVKKGSSKSSSKFESEDNTDDLAKKKAGSIWKGSETSSSSEKVKNTDKSSFAEDAKSHGKTSATDSKSKSSKSKDKLSHGKDADADDDDRPTFRHNKPMHKCVTRGLRSTYGAQGVDKYTFGGMADSVYEYLPKSYLLLGGLEPQYQRMHESAMAAAKEYLLFRTMHEDPKRPIYFTGDFMTQGTWNNETDRIQGTFTPHTGHLTCFQGAFIALAARAFRNEPDVDVARRLTDGCIWAYEQTNTGIMPELFDMTPCANLSGPCPWNETKWWNDIDPWAKDKVAVYQQLADETDRETIAAAKGDLKGTSSMVGKAADQLEAKVSRPENDIKATKHEPRDAPTVPSELNHLAERRPPSELHGPSNTNVVPADASSSAVPNPTSIPEYFDQQVSQKRLSPGITKMNAREYILRPEAIESVFYLYRITGDPYFREKGWKMFEAIDNATSTTHGNSAIQDVTAPAGKVQLRDKAESFWTAETLKYFWLLFSDPETVSLDDWVFNTEAHPFRRPDLDVKREASAERMRRRKGMGGGMVWDLD